MSAVKSVADVIIYAQDDAALDTIYAALRQSVFSVQGMLVVTEKFREDT